MQLQNTGAAQPQNDFEFDLATMALKGKRFVEAQQRFTNLASTTNSYIAWCGLAYSKLGLIMEDITVDEVFFCFQRGRMNDDSGTNDTEKIAIQATVDVIRNMYSLCAQAEPAITKAEKEKRMAVVSAVVHTAFMMGSRIEGKTLDSLVSAGFTAVSYQGYLKAGASIDELKALVHRVQDIIKALKQNLADFVETEKTLLDAGIEEIEKYRREYMAIARPTVPQAITSERGLRDRRVEILNDPHHEFHRRKAGALNLAKRKKNKAALRLVNVSLRYVPDDDDLLAAQKDIIQRLNRKDWWIWLIPGVYCLSFIEDRSQDNLMALFVLFGIALLMVRTRSKNRLKLGLEE